VLSAKRHVDGRLISYAQCGEDMVLWRAFSEQDSGFYIDVGANHPYRDSVTKIFYDAGWHGINVEPVAEFYDALTVERDRDVNLCVAVSDRTGETAFHVNRSNPDLSTIESDVSTDRRERGDDVMEIVVPVLTLADIIEQYAPDRDIDFLKVDTEGHEKNVIIGNDWDRFRPKVVVLEAPFELGPPVIDFMESVRYEYTLNDGLNRWFVRADCMESIGPALSRPALPVPDMYHPSFYIDALVVQHEQILALQSQVADLSNRNRI
jgi:FkbM family methyltransferase